MHGLCSVASAGRLLQNWQEPPLLPRIARSPRHPGVVRFATRSRCVFLTHTPQHISCPDSTQFQLECRHLHFKKSCALPLIPETPLIDPTHRRQSNGLGWRPSRHARRAQVLLSATPTGSQMQEAPGQLQKGDSDVGLLPRTACNRPAYCKRKNAISGITDRGRRSNPKHDALTVRVCKEPKVLPSLQASRRARLRATDAPWSQRQWTLLQQKRSPEGWRDP